MAMSVSYKERALVILVHLYLITYVLSFDWITYIIKAFIKCAPFLNSNQCIEVRFDSFLSGGFTTMVVINPPNWKLANSTSVQWRVEWQVRCSNPGQGKIFFLPFQYKLEILEIFFK